VPKRIFARKVKNCFSNLAALEVTQKVLIVIQYLYSNFGFLLVDSKRVSPISPVVEPIACREGDKASVVKSPSAKSKIEENPCLLGNAWP
jgi:hypothetical protein